MSVGLYVFGVLICAAGVLMVGFGIPINEFSLGNTLIVAGTSATAGGMIVIGLAAAVRQLKRIADALAPRGARPAPRVVEPAEPVVVAAARPAAGRTPPPAKPRTENREPHIDQPGARSVEPRLSAAGIEPPEEAVIERPRPVALSRGGQTPLVEDSGETPLSPRPPFRPNIQPPPPSDVPDLVETKSWTSMPPFERFRSAAAGGRRSSTNSETIARTPPPTPGFFDSVWPAGRGAEPKVVASNDRAPKDNAPEMRAPDQAPHDDTAAAGDEPQPVSILKSGVVDGMAYTLYTDGSIEAELAEGVLRFGSIEELRVHLEKQG